MALADAVFVWASPDLYAVSRIDVAEMLISLITQPGVLLEHKSRAIVALTIFRTYNLDFGDAYTAAAALEDAIPKCSRTTVTSTGFPACAVENHSLLTPPRRPRCTRPIRPR